MSDGEDLDLLAAGIGFEVGQRVRLIEMPDDPCPIEPGSEGTVRNVVQLDRYVQLWVDWDCGRSLSPIIPPDTLEVI